MRLTVTLMWLRSGPRKATARPVHPSGLAEFTIGPATSGQTRWLVPQDDGGGRHHEPLP
jgi:hypothetical protein